LKRILVCLLTLALTLTPVLTLAEAAATEAPADQATATVQPSDDSDDNFQDAGDIDSPETLSVPDDGGLKWDANSMTIALPEDASSGYAWDAELDDETVLTLDSDSVSDAQDGALPNHTFVYKPAADGTALVSLYYEQQDGDDVGAMLSYTVTVEGGKITGVDYEDLSDWGDEGDDEGGTLYEGESGGVPLYLPDGMSVVSTDNGVTKLENDDKSVWMTIQYDPNADAEALLKGFEDEAGLEKQYTDASKGLSFLSTTVDRDDDPARGILVYEIVKDDSDTIIEHTVYVAPNGGALTVETGYAMQ
jgi:predicted secreted protein